jgi:hypothetical protein
MNALEFIILTIILLLLLLIVLGPIVLGAPYYPTEKIAVKSLLKLVSRLGISRACDLGSGDGRVVIELANAGISVDGFEINPILAVLSIQRIKRRGIDNAHIKFSNFWRVDLSNYDLVFVFGLKSIMSRLEKKLLSELKPGSYVASFAFRFRKLKCVKHLNGLHLYEI